MTKRIPSRYVCGLCGLGVHLYGAAKGDVWKHSGGAHSTSCGKPPRVVLRETYDAEMASIGAQVASFIRR